MSEVVLNDHVRFHICHLDIEGHIVSQIRSLEKKIERSRVFEKTGRSSLLLPDCDSLIRLEDNLALEDVVVVVLQQEISVYATNSRWWWP